MNKGGGLINILKCANKKPKVEIRITIYQLALYDLKR